VLVTENIVSMCLVAFSMMCVFEIKSMKSEKKNLQWREIFNTHPDRLPGPTKSSVQLVLFFFCGSKVGGKWH